MAANEYDNADFFDEYARMARSRRGLSGAGEWRQFRAMFPELAGRRVLDLGCGYGWHCAFAAAEGAAEVLGIDASRRMLARAAQLHTAPEVRYCLCDILDYPYPAERWDCVISNLALHYVADLDAVFGRVWRTLTLGGSFLVNIEHPTFTAGVGQDWVYDAAGRPQYWPVDDYFRPGERVTNFLGRVVTKQHHTLTQILNGLLNAGFCLRAVEEAQPPAEWMHLPGMADELRRPMMLLVRADKC